MKMDKFQPMALIQKFDAIRADIQHRMLMLDEYSVERTELKGICFGLILARTEVMSLATATDRFGEIGVGV